MNELVLHIEFLLHTHNCVIVPDFGGFVVNYTSAKHDGLAVVEPPHYELVFNKDLTHNDGLLAESYMKTENISFDAAVLKIKQAVRALKSELEERKFIDMQNLGSFTIDKDFRFIYSPVNFVRPDLFGLTKAVLKPVIQLNTAERELQKHPSNRRAILRRAAIGTAAAAVITACMFIFPLEGDKLNVQTAKMFSEMKIFNRAAEKVSVAESVAPAATQIEVSEIPAVDFNEAIDASEVSVDENTPKYYIVMAVFESQRSVDKAVNMLEQDGFSNIQTLKRYGKQHIYTASFSNKDEALTYLNNIRTDYRQYRDAWVLKY